MCATLLHLLQKLLVLFSLKACHQLVHDIAFIQSAYPIFILSQRILKQVKTLLVLLSNLIHINEKKYYGDIILNNVYLTKLKPRGLAGLGLYTLKIANSLAFNK
jgi:hypothetical protein